MRKYGILIALLAAFALSACGGGSTSLSTGASASSSSSSSSSGGVINTVASITLISSLPQLPSNNSTAATITAIVKNSANAVVPNSTVVFSATTGVIAPAVTSVTGSVAGVSDVDGEAQATLTTPGNLANRTITVTATVGTVSAQVNVDVVGTALSITGPSSLIEGNSGTYSAALTDSGGTGIPNATITIASAKGNTLSAPSLTTNATGHATFTMTASAAGNDTLTGTALGVSAQQAVSVSSQAFNFTVPAANTSVVLGAAQPVTVVWTNNGAPVANQTVTFSTTRGLFTGNATTTTATTDSTGTASASISSTTAGAAVVTASGTGVSSQLTLDFVATNPSQIDVQASPSSIQTSGSSTITAIVRDAQNNLVQGQTVDFQLTDKTGGTISVASGITDETGRAQTVYTATTVASPSNGVVVTGTIQGTLLQGTATITVGGQTVFLSLGTGNKISENPGQTQFIMPWSVLALDASGNPVSGVTISMKVVSLPPTGAPPVTAPNYNTTGQYAAYLTGGYTLTCGANATGWCQAINALCLNEDVAGDGIAPNGVTLLPGNVASVSPGTVTTDSTGTASVNVIYPEDHANWVQVQLSATAGVSGTQTTTSSSFLLPILATYLTNTDASPPGAVSPYGVSPVCANTPN